MGKMLRLLRLKEKRSLNPHRFTMSHLHVCWVCSHDTVLSGIIAPWVAVVVRARDVWRPQLWWFSSSLSFILAIFSWVCSTELHFPLMKQLLSEWPSSLHHSWVWVKTYEILMWLDLRFVPKPFSSCLMHEASCASKTKKTPDYSSCAPPIDTKFEAWWTELNMVKMIWTKMWSWYFSSKRFTSSRFTF